MNNVSKRWWTTTPSQPKSNIQNLLTAQHQAHPVNPSAPLTVGHSGASSSPSQPISSTDLWSQRSIKLIQSTLTFGHSAASSSPSQPISSTDLWSQQSIKLTQSTHKLQWPLVIVEHQAHPVNPSSPLTFGHSEAKKLKYDLQSDRWTGLWSHLRSEVLVQVWRHGDRKRFTIVKVRSITAANNDCVVVREIKELVDTEWRRLHIWNKKKQISARKQLLNLKPEPE